MTHTCVGELGLASSNGLLPVQLRVIIWTSADVGWLAPKETYMTMSSAEYQPIRLCLNVLIT